MQYPACTAAPTSVSRRRSTFTTGRSPGPGSAQVFQATGPVCRPALPPFDASVSPVQGGGVIAEAGRPARSIPGLEQVSNILVQLLYH